MPDSEVRFVRVAAVRGPLQGSPTPSLREHRFVRDPNAPNGPPPQGVRGRRISPQFKLCKNQRFDLPGPKTRFFSTRRPQNLHVVQSAQTRTRPLAIDMHVGGRANTRSRDPGRTKLYCQSSCLCVSATAPSSSSCTGRLAASRTRVTYPLRVCLGFGAGGRLPIWHGVGGFMFDSSSSRRSARLSLW